MLRVDKIQKTFDGFMAIKEANLRVSRGEIVATIGPNGAGKTTLFNVITGQLRPNQGKVFFQEEDITNLPPHRICRKGLARSFQIVNVFNRLSVFENVQVAVLSREKKTLNLFHPCANMYVQETMDILKKVGLAPKAGDISATLSHGDQKVLEMAIALGHDPKMLILDEPTAGMSPEETAQAMALIQHLCTELGLTILLCEHDMHFVFSIAHSIMVMHQGRTIIQDTPQKIREDPQVQEAYLGDAVAC
ncbi:MAG: ABC transporter ATP-binding protein [Desulfovermiculus sp.]|nr:ABC transporter ATP-binding protein [Desulfovermiculus sp.]